MGLFIDGALSASNPFHLTLVFFAGYLSLSFGIADFVLYIWVDDVFVRRNKILFLLFFSGSDCPAFAVFFFVLPKFNYAYINDINHKD